MRDGAALLGVFWVGFVAAGCTSDLELSLDGKLCNADDRCLDDYQCDLETKRCVPLLGQPVGGGGSGGRGGSSAGVGGAPGNGGAGIVGYGGDSAGGRYGNGGTNGVAGAASMPAAAGAAGVAGVAGAGAGAGGASPNDLDAGLEPDANGGCVATTVYRDDDGDLVGDTSDPRIACPGPGWVTTGGDCRDDIAEVFRGQTAYFAFPYIDQPSANGVSFDYDCDGLESPQFTEPPPPDCTTILLGLSCMGSGHLPADPPRSGGGSEPRCGSNLRRVCTTAGLLTCNNDDTPAADDLRFRCR